jgi:hypothetical protein
MTHKIILAQQKFVAGFLVFAMMCAVSPIAALAATAGATNTDQSRGGTSIEGLAQDTIGAVAAAAIACNKQRIQSGIKSLFTSAAQDATQTAADEVVASTTGTNPNQLVHLSATSSTDAAIKSIAASADAQTEKATCTNAIEKAAAGVILRQLTISTVNWINHGLNGNPFYATDTGSVLKSVGDSSIKSLNQVIGFDSKNYPFGQSVARSLALQLGSSFEQASKYSLNQVIAQQYPGMTNADFQRNFAIGGWDAWLAQTALNNNPFGFSMQAESVASSRLQDTAYSPGQDLRDQLLRSGGFYDQKVCADPNYNNNAGLAASNAATTVTQEKATAARNLDSQAADALAIAQASGNAAAIAAARARLAAADATSAQADTELTAAIASNAAVVKTAACQKWTVQTPGSVIAHALTSSLDTTNNQLINGQDLSTDITAIFDALTNQLVNKGLSSLTSNSGVSSVDYSQNSNGTTSNNQTVVIDTQANGSWSNQGSNFNVFKDIPTVIRYEDNDPKNESQGPSGCDTTPGQVTNGAGQFCKGDPSFSEGYQQILRKKLDTGRELLSNIYSFDYCIPGPHPGWQDEIESRASNFVANPNVFPASSNEGDVKKVLATWGSTVGSVVGIAAGVVAGAVLTSVGVGATLGSAVPVLGTAIGAVVGLAVGLILTQIGKNKDHENEAVYGKFIEAMLGISVEHNPDGAGRQHVNGHDPSASIITVLAARYKEAMQMVYLATDGQATAAERRAATDPSGTLPAANANLSIPDLLSVDRTEYQKIDTIKSSLAQNQAYLDSSRSIELQLVRLMGRIQNLRNLDGYPGVTAPLDLVPVIHLVGSSVVTLNKGATYVDAGATATSVPEDSTLTSKIIKTGAIDTSYPGTYTITYDVTNKAGISASQVTRSVRVIDPATGNPGPIITNNAKNISTSSNFATANVGEDISVAVRDYYKDLQAVQNLTNTSSLSDYEVELRRINNTFQQIAPYIHGPQDLKNEEAAYYVMENESKNLVDFKPDGTLNPNSLMAQCIHDTSGTTSQYIKAGGPTARVSFNFIASEDGAIGSLPAWLLEKLPPVPSFLPDWHYAMGGGGLILTGRNPFPDDGEPTYPPDLLEKELYFQGYRGQEMKMVGAEIETQASLTIDYNKLIHNDDVANFTRQPMWNSLVGLEHIVGMY